MYWGEGEMIECLNARMFECENDRMEDIRKDGVIEYRNNLIESDEGG